MLRSSRSPKVVFVLIGDSPKVAFLLIVAALPRQDAYVALAGCGNVSATMRGDESIRQRYGKFQSTVSHSGESPRFFLRRS
jgi:hypothetical protein